MKDAELLHYCLSLFIPAFKDKFDLTEKAADSLLSFMNVLLKNINQNHPGSNRLPKSIKTLMSRFHNEKDRTEITEYTTCPSCHFLYRPLPEIRVSCSSHYINSNTIRLTCSFFTHSTPVHFQRHALLSMLMEKYVELNYTKSLYQKGMGGNSSYRCAYTPTDL